MNCRYQKIAILLGLLFISIAGDGAGDKTLLAVFAHPDDESTVAPILARYAREGARVYVIIATDGRYGTNDFSGFEAGDELVAVRREEMRCSADILGVELLHLDYQDQFRAAEGYAGHVPHMQSLTKEISGLITRLEPDAIITWGPDGGSNHMDHRLVGDTVTGVFLGKDWGWPMSLYYYGTPRSYIDDEEGRALYAVVDRYMTTVISYEAEDFRKAAESLSCHKTQFTEAEMDRMLADKKKLGNRIFLRKFEPPSDRSNSLFQE